MMRTLIFLLLACCLWPGCTAADRPAETIAEPEEKPVQEPLKPVPAAALLNMYLPKLQGKNVGLVVNQTSLVNNTHLVDTLLSAGIQVRKIFAPEHGFRGEADAGAHIKDSRDPKTGLPIVSIYGSNKKPAPEQLQGLDILVFDIQDVGTRFYTYISSMHYVMEACAENGLPLLVLDRPNPNGDYVDGPVRKPGFESFVSMHPIPVVHGLTVGELANMINGEGWLEGGRTCQLSVLPVENYTHQTPWALPVRPSPNLPNQQAVRWYPSLCLFEATMMSIGRGTPFPFQVVGYPDAKYGDFSFTPVSTPGAALHPKLQDKQCFGLDFRQEPAPEAFSLQPLIRFYQLAGDHEKFIDRSRMFNLLAGTDELQKQLKAGLGEEEIRASWEADLAAYKQMRRQYLLYPDANQ